MKHIFLIIFSLSVLSCEKENDKPDINKIETYLQDYSGFIYQYSAGTDTVELNPDIEISFSDYDLNFEDSRIYISGSFFSNLPNYETPFNNYIDFVYHEENLNRALKLDTFYHVSSGIQYTYYLKNQ